MGVKEVISDFGFRISDIGYRIFLNLKKSVNIERNNKVIDVGFFELKKSTEIERSNNLKEIRSLKSDIRKKVTV